MHNCGDNPSMVLKTVGAIPCGRSNQNIIWSPGFEKMWRRRNATSPQANSNYVDNRFILYVSQKTIYPLTNHKGTTEY